jgi:hypothetical protein
VGSTLARANRYDALFNSKNIQEIEGKSFEQIVCAGVSAVKWLANKEPEADWQGIQKLISSLDKVQTEKFVLVSTVDVYPSPVDVDENDEPDMAVLQPYGRHRLLLEQWVKDRFKSVTIVRLPALFGTGLRKNIIFDLLNDNMTDKINGNSAFQWYPMRRFPDDLALIEASGEELVNVAVEPVLTTDIVARFFPQSSIGFIEGATARYDMQTVKPDILGGRSKYHISADQVFSELEAFISEERK